MSLGDLIDYVGNLLDYDPTNEVYRAQLVSLINEAQTRVLTDRPWDFAQRDRVLQVWTDTTVEVSVSNGSATVAGTAFPASTSTIKPGSNFDGAVLRWTDSGGVERTHVCAWVENINVLFLDRDYEGASGTYTATVRRREIYLPSDCAQVSNVSDPVVGVPMPSYAMSKFEREQAVLDPALLGTIEAYLPSQGKRVPAPRTARGVATVAAVGQGARTLHIYMVNVSGPFATNFPAYPREVSDGFESAFSAVSTYVLSDTQTLEFTPEVLPSRTGLYRRYYFTCPEAGIRAPVRIRNSDTEQGSPAVGVDTINPKGTITLKPDLSLGTLEGQSFQSTSVRYVWANSAVYQSIQLYPHPSGDQQLNVRMLIAPSRMQEDQDAPLIPHAYESIIAYAALEDLTLKVDNAALSAVYGRKKMVFYQGMEQAYLKVVPRRLIKGEPSTGSRNGYNVFGPLKLIP